MKKIPSKRAELRMKFEDRGVLGVTLDVHMTNTGAMGRGSDEQVADRKLLQELLDNWEPSVHNADFDNTVNHLVYIALNENELGNLTYRPTFDEYFLLLAFDVSLRSDDPDIKHGALIVSYQNHIIGTGYNATIKGADETKVPYHIRDQKRLWMIHAEENAILNCMVNPLTLVEGAKIYITGIPCVNCLQRMINFGIKEIYYAKRDGSITENNETEKMRQEIIKMSKIKIHEMDIPHKWK